MKVTQGRCVAVFTAAVFGGVNRTLAMTIGFARRSNVAVAASDVVMVRLASEGM